MANIRNIKEETKTPRPKNKLTFITSGKRYLFLRFINRHQNKLTVIKGSNNNRIVVKIYNHTFILLVLKMNFAKLIIKLPI